MAEPQETTRPVMDMLKAWRCAHGTRAWDACVDSPCLRGAHFMPTNERESVRLAATVGLHLAAPSGVTDD